ncbi:hypothetical protein F1880_006447 [Penicillium rolfsii]|nr:hypothetical protein F1880_006447 [Penicillium rolfsii]
MPVQPSPRKVRHRRKVVHRRQGGVRKPKARSLIKDGQQGPITDQASRKSKKKSKPRIPESEDPLEDNVYERTTMPEGYSFVPKGDVYITRKCRLLTKDSNQVVYKVYNQSGKRSLGIRVPSDIYNEVLAMSQETEKTRASATKARDTKFHNQGRKLLRDQFPLMPEDVLDVILEHSFQKGSGRVGRTGTLSDSHKAQLAVEAHVRHKYTPYEDMLKDGVDRLLARRKVWDTVQTIRKAWEGTASKKDECLTLRLG